MSGNYEDLLLGNDENGQPTGVWRRFVEPSGLILERSLIDHSFIFASRAEQNRQALEKEQKEKEQEAARERERQRQAAENLRFQQLVQDEEIQRQLHAAYARGGDELLVEIQTRLRAAFDYEKEKGVKEFVADLHKKNEPAVERERTQQQPDETPAERFKRQRAAAREQDIKDLTNNPHGHRHTRSRGGPSIGR